MPLPLAPLISGASQLLTTGINAGVQGLTNAKNRKFARENRDMARQWALDDWNAQNEYNSPKSQMERFKAANLNPHLIYGQTNEGATVRSSGTPDASAVAPKLDLTADSAINAYNETRMADANYNNALLQAKVLEEERILKKAQTTSTLADAESKGVNTERARFELGIESELRPYSLQFRQGQVRKQDMEIIKGVQDTIFTKDSNARAWAQNAASLKEVAARILNYAKQNAKTDAEMQEIQHRINNLDREGRLKDMEIEMRKSGLTPNSPPMLHWLDEFIGDDVKKFFNKAKEARRSFWKTNWHK